MGLPKHPERWQANRCVDFENGSYAWGAMMTEGFRCRYSGSHAEIGDFERYCFC